MALRLGANAPGNLGPNQFAGAGKYLWSLQGVRCSFGKTNEFDEVDLSKLPVIHMSAWPKK